MSDAWTIERIHDALGVPAVASRFLAEINRAPAHQLLAVFAKWERIAKDTVAAAERVREMAAAEDRGEDPMAGWRDATDEVTGSADRIHKRGAA